MKECFAQIVIFCIGLSSIALMLFLLRKANYEFTTPLLGLFSIGIGLIVFALVNPESFKIGLVEITQKAKKATAEAEKASKLAAETSAMLLWNNGRWGSKTRTDEAKKILEKVYGKNEANVKLAKFIESGLFEVTDEEKKELLNNIDSSKHNFSTSPLYQLLIEKPQQE